MGTRSILTVSGIVSLLFINAIASACGGAQQMQPPVTTLGHEVCDKDVYEVLDGDEDEEEPAPCPDDMVFVAGMGVCIDRYEWPNKKGTHPKIDASGLREGHVKKGEVHDADALCKSVGKRTCMIDEWVEACKGPDGAKYPWGDKKPKGKAMLFKNEGKLPCNFNKKYRSYGGKAGELKIWKRDKKWLDHLNQSEPSGNRETCKSAVGAYDMTGNAEEWVRCPGKAKYGWCLMGRFWSQLYECKKAITGHHSRWHYYTTGFRCCKDVEEGED